MDNNQEDQYICVGVCMLDPDSGYCQGCGRPPLESPGIVAELIPKQYIPVSHNDPDTPE
jgi:hypothetical protein